MITIDMPNGQELRIEHVVFDYNGTLAVDGMVSDEVRNRLIELKQQVHVVVITADTFHLAQSQLGDIPGIELVILAAGQGGAAKGDFVRRLGEHVVVVGNGVNDYEMFLIARGICVIGREGASGRTLGAADMLVTRPEDALDLLLKGKRMVATLRE